jgi:hypothetical protein
MVAGFGAGKTEALIVRSIIGKLKSPETDRAFYEPTYDLIRLIAWPRFEEILSSLGIPYTLKKSPLNVLEIEGHGRIVFRSMDNPSRIIGYEVGDSDVDELDTLKRDDAAEAWRRILSRNRQKKKSGVNTAAVATTPEGFRFVYEAWGKKPKDGYEIIKAATYSNPHLPDGYIQSLKDIYPEHLLSAYLDGDFVNLTSGRVYPYYCRKKNRSSETVQKGDILFIGMDFNVGNMSAVVHVKREGKPVAVSEITGAMDTPGICGVIKSRYPNHKIIVNPDSSGGSRKSVDAGLTDIKILRDNGFSVHAPKKNPRVRDRVNAMNAALEKGYKVNADTCPEYARSLEQQAYAKNGEPDKTGGHDHLNDAAGYFIWSEYPLNKPAMSIKMGMAQ